MRSLQLISFCAVILSSLSLYAQDNELIAMKKFELGDYESAIESYQLILSENPNNEEAMIRLAESMRMTSRLQEAIDWYGKVADMQKPAKPFIFNYAKCLQELGYYQEAKNWFLKYAEIDPVKGRHFALSCDYAVQHYLRSDVKVQELKISNEPSSELWPAFLGEQLVLMTTSPQLVREGGTGEWVKGFVRKWKRGFENDYIRNELQSTQKWGPLAYNQRINKVALTSYTGNIDFKNPAPIESFSLFLADADQSGNWNKTQPFPFNVSGYSTGYPSWNSDDNAMYFASNRPGGFGGYDIYVSYYDNGQWTYPQNLGNAINSSGDEISPNMIDGTLYFASNYHHGFGGFDLFKAEMNGFTFGSPENLGLPVNSSKDDWCLQMDPTQTFGFYNSNRGEDNRVKVNHLQTVHQAADLAAVVTPREEVMTINELPEIRVAKSKTITSNSSLAQYTSFDVPVVQNNVRSTAINTSEEEQTETFFIQVAALSKYKDNVEQFKPLTRFGHVYRVEVNGISKIRVGQFRSMGAAVEALKEIKRTGFPDAYVVQEFTDPSKLDLLLSGATATKMESTQTAVKQKTPVHKDQIETKISTPATPAKVYKVRLTAYHYNTQFDTKTVADLGEIEQWTKGNWRIILIGGYKNLHEAKSALITAKERGFQDAYLVVEEDGLLLPYEEK